MNRLIIVGNGFDIAHGLPTFYYNFVDFIWQNIKYTETNNLFKNLFEINFHYLGKDSFINFKDFTEYVNSEAQKNLNYEVIQNNKRGIFFKVLYKARYPTPMITVFTFHNKFFEYINAERIANWVQIEDIYYKILISLVKKNGDYSEIKDINQLNREFEEIKAMLTFYLNREVIDKYDFNSDINDLLPVAKILEFKFQGLQSDLSSSYFTEFTNIDKKLLVHYDSLIHQNQRQGEQIQFENLFVDFNYTPTVLSYVKALNNNPYKYGKNYHIQIHGNLTDPDNPLNFGFGDEMDDQYKVLENARDNAYLENIKSFLYLNNYNYKDLLTWMREKDFQVLIFGHSCGLSDRTLLNTVFENENCKSIKIFYHKKENGEDNFRTLAMDISRHFNKKSVMRDKIVNKSRCQELPQTIRFKMKK